MTVRQKNNLWLVFILFYVLLYYSWILFIPQDSIFLMASSLSIALIVLTLPFLWLLGAAKRSSGEDRIFWMLLSAGSLSYVLASSIWITYEAFLNVALPYPGPADIFYQLNILFYLFAFGYKIFKNKRTLRISRFLVDILLVMTLFWSLSWYYLLEPIATTGNIPIFTLALSLSYPLYDLILLSFVMILSFTGKKIFSKRLLLFYYTGLVVYIIADSTFAYLISINAYASGSLADPLFAFGVLLIGYTGLIQKEEKKQPSQFNRLKTHDRVSFLHILFPFLSIGILYILMLITAPELTSVMIGVGVSLLFISFRQLIIHYDNQQLLTKYLKNTAALESNQEKYQSLFDNHPDAAYSFDLHGTVESVNGRGAEILGVTKDDLIGNPIIDFIHEEYKETVRQKFLNTLVGDVKDYDFPLTNQFNEFYYLNITHIPIKSNGEIIGVYAIARDTTENKINQQQIEYMAYHDHLTHLVNRVRFEEVLQSVIDKAQHTETKFALLFMDLNNFKQINDEYGHAFGDLLLTEVATRIKSVVTDPDHAARLGGDEFTLFIDGLKDYDDSMRRASQLLDVLNKPYTIDGKQVVSTPSVGFAYYPKDGKSVQELLNKADSSMYENKRMTKKLG
ncbi:MAG: diguanylate cyclase [Alkalibacterium sp.]|nr:diguanylate cyclase [Alkalibacterium sp.]